MEVDKQEVESKDANDEKEFFFVSYQLCHITDHRKSINPLQHIFLNRFISSLENEMQCYFH